MSYQNISFDTESEPENDSLAEHVFDAHRDDIAQDGAKIGGPFIPDEDRKNAAGYTMFDAPSADDNAILVVVPKDRIEKLPSQASVRIKSRDGRVYLGTVVRGPYSLPDGLRPDASPIVATALRGVNFLPEYHEPGRGVLYDDARQYSPRRWG